MDRCLPRGLARELNAGSSTQLDALRAVIAVDFSRRLIAVRGRSEQVAPLGRCWADRCGVAAEHLVWARPRAVAMLRMTESGVSVWWWGWPVRVRW